MSDMRDRNELHGLYYTDNSRKEVQDDVPKNQYYSSICNGDTWI